MKEVLHVVKIGGKLINEKSDLLHFLSEFVKLPDPKILIHGGGRKATELSALLGIETKMIDGRRITDKDTLDVAIMVYAGLINKTIVAQLSSFGLDAIGLCGADGDLIRAIKRPVESIDYGFVGDIIDINDEFILGLLAQNIIPLICPISHDGNGQLLNTNADTIAGRIAASLVQKYAVELSYCFEYDGVLYDLDQPQMTISSLNSSEIKKLIDQGDINSGMIPKLHNGIHALRSGVDQVNICGINNLISKAGATNIIL